MPKRRRMNHPDPICPITLFDDHDEVRSDRFVEPTFLEFVEFISDEAGGRFEREDDAWLFAPCSFRDGLRSPRSGLVMLEVRGGLTLEIAGELLSGNGLAGFIYTTATHAEHRQAFRIGIPVIEPVYAATYSQAWTAINRLFDCAADWGRSGADSVFRVPACIGGREARLFVLSGDIHSAEDRVEALGRSEHQHVGPS